MKTAIPRREERTVNLSIPERVISAASGGVLIGYGLMEELETKARLPLLIVGGVLLLRGLSGVSVISRLFDIRPAGDKIDRGVRVERAIAVHRPVEEVFAFWMALENLPRFMEHLESVTVRDDGTSHWIAKGPLGTKVEWDGRITAVKPGELIAWESLPGSSITNAGEVRFLTGPGGQGTAVYVTMEYKAPGGPVGTALARLLGEEPDLQIREDLKRFKELLESGAVALPAQETPQL